MTTANLTMFAYIIASVCFIMSLKGLSSPISARSGNMLGIVGMVIAIITTALSPEVSGYGWIITAIIIGGGIGTFSAFKVQMTGLPQMVALFNAFGGLASALVAISEVLTTNSAASGIDLTILSVGLIIGAVTFTGSIVAYAKLQGLIKSGPKKLPFHYFILISMKIAMLALIVMFIMNPSILLFSAIAALAFTLGALFILPIGGADMPVVIAVLNSYSGLAGAVIGFALSNALLVVTGSLVGASGAILSYVMCKGMNRSLLNVLMGGFGSSDSTAGSSSDDGEDRTAKQGSADDAAFIMKNAQSVIIVPGYGMAVAQAQHAVQEMATALKAEGVEVKYAIHPVAGRMPGHMNVLLAEANVPYEDVFELDNINSEFARADVAYVIGANDVTNTKAKTDPTCEIYGMPILDVENAKTVLFVKRSLSPGYSGVDNPLFFADNTMMLFGDAKKVTENIVREL
ncbi:MAG: NAD(P)(+) transhydrogenase (Re/Si-specific) subunit beta [Alphaproteobacteria bacterium]|nr:NAD(P)(+) transhydrogenase (Re/Si-specific) subunit beta [Alphaproteobacteria bacterium]